MADTAGCAGKLGKQFHCRREQRGRDLSAGSQCPAHTGHLEASALCGDVLSHLAGMLFVADTAGLRLAPVRGYLATPQDSCTLLLAASAQADTRYAIPQAGALILYKRLVGMVTPTGQQCRVLIITWNDRPRRIGDDYDLVNYAVLKVDVTKNSQPKSRNGKSNALAGLASTTHHSPLAPRSM